MKAVLIGLRLKRDDCARDMYIQTFTGPYAIADARYIMWQLERSRYEERYFNIVSDREATEAWGAQQPHLDEKYLRSLK